MKEKLIQWWNEAALPRLKRAWQEFYLFISSMFFLKNFGAMLGTIVLLLVLIFWWLKCYTHHGESLQVHDYTGMTLEEAIEKARSRSFRIQVNDSTWQEGKPANIVLEQSPEPYSRVKENRTIYLKVTKKIPETVLLPTLVGNYDDNQYSKKLKRKGIKTVVKERVWDNKQAPGTILYFYYNDEKITENEVSEGLRIPKSTTLEFVITERGIDRVNLPNLVCRRFSEAEFLVTGQGLTLGEIQEDATVSDRANAYVISQTPAYQPGQTLRVGEQISVVLTQYPPVGCDGQ